MLVTVGFLRFFGASIYGANGGLKVEGGFDIKIKN